ncbi:3-hydroxyacyl-[acyl-carrier-protein] dehydratase FabZ [Buchnera aphidicola]|uniref:3-hydroxyacyl-[acyl-carrier-protein] dehydratase FabZ n=1 Tax=Buchnera aphidicola TaxID=9 RepID=UPI0030EC188D
MNIKKKNKFFKNVKICDIEKYLPYKFPFLFIDKIIYFKNSKKLTSIKKISFKEKFLKSHFPNNPVFPGVLIIESILQSCFYLIHKSAYINYKFKFCNKKLCYVSHIKKTIFKKFVVLNDLMIINIKIKKKYKNFVKIFGIVTVNKFLVCKTSLLVYSENARYI